MLFDSVNQKKPFRLIAFDLDGTLTQHKSPLEDAARKTLNALSERYKLLMVGAGRCEHGKIPNAAPRYLHHIRHIPFRNYR